MNNRHKKLTFDPLHHPYPSRRFTVFGRRGMVAASHPLAAQSGLQALQQGGNAVDAAVAAAACLTVVEPTSNGIGGDAFALVWHQGKLYGLNASGPSPKRISLDTVLREGCGEMPAYGWTPVNVPGAPAAWAELAHRFGRLPLTLSLAPAIAYAEEGHPVAPVVGRYWQAAFREYAQNLRGEAFRPWFDTFAPKGRAPATGEIWRSPDHARTLQSIAESGAASFYRGDLTEKIDAFSRQTGGFLRGDDLERYRPEWVDPIRIDYKGYQVWEIPPNGHGIVALMALNILKGFDFTERESEAAYHHSIEALKLAFADGKRYIADPRRMTVSVEDLLSDAYAEERRRQIGPKALTPSPGMPHSGGTVYLAAADGEGTMVSYIQSNYMGFGSGLVVPGTGIALHNRGRNFSLDPAHPNCLEPEKKPYHTIIPGFLSKGDQAVGPFGVMGAFMQPQGHVQVVLNTVDFGLNPQAALDAPRWQWTEGKRVELEPAVPEAIREALARRGHHVSTSADPASFGRGQIIWRDESGVLAGGTEPRADGMIAVW
ncbi:gamma-glutamyltransferase [Heliobacterium undosum]|uniref:Gamma-glutamyltransferase n=1 Tax=Heliomicrobium undosum TaxID=121734 RepID=A0A845L2C1_9FIRM|nr:gamma-glutamyltransferase family protein [Heliomicrobium undosum]MZP30403.1 gamma-glutamyltransferase [Heliomicrobium undosum]